MEANTPPKLARRNLNHRSTMKSGRTIGEKRERLETASERSAAHKKMKSKKRLRIIFTTLGFIVAIIVVFWLFSAASGGNGEGEPSTISVITIPYTPTIEIVDEDTPTSASSEHLTSRMREYIGQIEADLREFGIIPVKAVIPTGSIREVDIYLEGHNGFVKTIIDRGAGVSAEDVDRMLRYLAENGINDFQYIDVRIDGKAYWK